MGKTGSGTSQVNTHSDELLRHLQQAVAILDEGDQTTLQSLHDVRKSLESVQNVDKKIPEWLNTLGQRMIQLNDIKNELLIIWKRPNSTRSACNSSTARNANLQYCA